MMKEFRPTRRVLMLILCAACLGALACARQPDAPSPTSDVMGFFMGFVHGFLIVFSFLASLFSDVRIYAYPNADVWYDFGYVLGAMVFLGGGGAGSRKGRRSK